MIPYKSPLLNLQHDSIHNNNNIIIANNNDHNPSQKTKRSPQNSYPIGSNGCVICPAAPPACPACPSDQICNLSLQTCDSCPSVSCVPISSNVVLNPANSPSSTQSQAPATSSAAPSTELNKSLVGPIVGGAVGAVAIIGFLAFLIFWLRKRKRNNNANYNNNNTNKNLSASSTTTFGRDMSPRSPTFAEKGTLVGPFYPDGMPVLDAAIGSPGLAPAGSLIPVNDNTSSFVHPDPDDSFMQLHRKNYESPDRRKIHQVTRKKLKLDNLAISSPKLISTTYDRPTTEVAKKFPLSEKKRRELEKINKDTNANSINSHLRVDMASVNHLKPSNVPGISPVSPIFSTAAVSPTIISTPLSQRQYQQQQQQQQHLQTTPNSITSSNNSGSTRSNETKSYPMPLILSERALKQSGGNQKMHPSEKEQHELRLRRQEVFRQQQREQEERYKQGLSPISVDNYSYMTTPSPDRRDHSPISPNYSNNMPSPINSIPSGELETVGNGRNQSPQSNTSNILPMPYNYLNTRDPSNNNNNNHANQDSNYPNNNKRDTQNSAMSSVYSTDVSVDPKKGRASHIIPIAYIPGVTTSRSPLNQSHFPTQDSRSTAPSNPALSQQAYMYSNNQNSANTSSSPSHGSSQSQQILHNNNNSALSLSTLGHSTNSPTIRNRNDSNHSTATLSATAPAIISPISDESSHNQFQSSLRPPLSSTRSVSPSADHNVTPISTEFSSTSRYSQNLSDQASKRSDVASNVSGNQPPLSTNSRRSFNLTYGQVGTNNNSRTAQPPPSSRQKSMASEGSARSTDYLQYPPTRNSRMTSTSYTSGTQTVSSATTRTSNAASGTCSEDYDNDEESSEEVSEETSEETSEEYSEEADDDDLYLPQNSRSTQTSSMSRLKAPAPIANTSQSSSSPATIRSQETHAESINSNETVMVPVLAPQHRHSNLNNELANNSGRNQQIPSDPRNIRGGLTSPFNNDSNSNNTKNTRRSNSEFQMRVNSKNFDGYDNSFDETEEEEDNQVGYDTLLYTEIEAFLNHQDAKDRHEQLQLQQLQQDGNTPGSAQQVSSDSDISPESSPSTDSLNPPPQQRFHPVPEHIQQQIQNLQRPPSLASSQHMSIYRQSTPPTIEEEEEEREQQQRQNNNQEYEQYEGIYRVRNRYSNVANNNYNNNTTNAISGAPANRLSLMTPANSNIFNNTTNHGSQYPVYLPTHPINNSVTPSPTNSSSASLQRQSAYQKQALPQQPNLYNQRSSSSSSPMTSTNNNTSSSSSNNMRPISLANRYSRQQQQYSPITPASSISGQETITMMNNNNYNSSNNNTPIDSPSSVTTYHTARTHLTNHRVSSYLNHPLPPPPLPSSMIPLSSSPTHSTSSSSSPPATSLRSSIIGIRNSQGYSIVDNRNINSGSSNHHNNNNNNSQSLLPPPRFSSSSSSSSNNNSNNNRVPSSSSSTIISESRRRRQSSGQQNQQNNNNNNNNAQQDHNGEEERNTIFSEISDFPVIYDENQDIQYIRRP